MQLEKRCSCSGCRPEPSRDSFSSHIALDGSGWQVLMTDCTVHFCAVSTCCVDIAPPLKNKKKKVHLSGLCSKQQQGCEGVDSHCSLSKRVPDNILQSLLCTNILFWLNLSRQTCTVGGLKHMGLLSGCTEMQCFASSLDPCP